MQPLEAPPHSLVFHITLGSSVWHVSRNGAFYGDYLSRGNAIRAACAGARDEERHGGVARVFEPPGTVALPHHEPHLSA